MPFSESRPHSRTFNVKRKKSRLKKQNTSESREEDRVKSKGNDQHNIEVEKRDCIWDTTSGSETEQSGQSSDITKDEREIVASSNSECITLDEETPGKSENTYPIENRLTDGSVFSLPSTNDHAGDNANRNAYRDLISPMTVLYDSGTNFFSNNQMAYDPRMTEKGNIADMVDTCHELIRPKKQDVLFDHIVRRTTQNGNMALRGLIEWKRASLKANRCTGKKMYTSVNSVINIMNAQRPRPRFLSWDESVLGWYHLEKDDLKYRIMLVLKGLEEFAYDDDKEYIQKFSCTDSLETGCTRASSSMMEKADSWLDYALNDILFFFCSNDAEYEKEFNKSFTSNGTVWSVSTCDTNESVLSRIIRTKKKSRSCIGQKPGLMCSSSESNQRNEAGTYLSYMSKKSLKIEENTVKHEVSEVTPLLLEDTTPSGYNKFDVKHSEMISDEHIIEKVNEKDKSYSDGNSSAYSPEDTGLLGLMQWSKSSFVPRRNKRYVYQAVESFE